jgi:hypothetical protein
MFESAQSAKVESKKYKKPRKRISGDTVAIVWTVTILGLAGLGTLIVCLLANPLATSLTVGGITFLLAPPFIFHWLWNRKLD